MEKILELLQIVVDLLQKIEYNTRTQVVGALSLCKSCHCMTHTIDGNCGKCKPQKLPDPQPGSYFITFRRLKDGQLEMSCHPEVRVYLEKYYELPQSV